MNKIKIIIISLISISFFGCTKWLQVESKDKIMEDKIFAKKSSFLSTLNGVYIELASANMYGANLSVGVLDVMAQYYDIRGNSEHIYNAFATYNWGSAATKGTMDMIWTRSYFLIANINTIIDKCDQVGDNVLGADLNKMIKGEALGLRAMIHLDLLRLFGPIMTNAENLSLDAIPYVTTSDRSIAPISTAKEVADKIMADLNSAEELLSNDPVIKNGQTVGEYKEESTTFAYRQYRLNYFAVRALKARLEIWRGNKSEALNIATNLIASTAELFKLTPSEQAGHHLYPNRIFSTEMLFGLYHLKREDEIFKRYFSPEISANSILTLAGGFVGGRLDKFYNDQNDYRYKMWAEKTVDNVSVVFNTKFSDLSGDDNWSTNDYRYAVPLISMSEIYLLAAECSDNLDNASDYLNALRKARGVRSINLNADNHQTIVLEEFEREMIGQGQLFFMFKRLALTDIPNGSEVEAKSKVELGIYVVPLPDSETSQRDTK